MMLLKILKTIFLGVVLLLGNFQVMAHTFTYNDLSEHRRCEDINHLNIPPQILPVNWMVVRDQFTGNGGHCNTLAMTFFLTRIILFLSGIGIFLLSKKNKYTIACFIIFLIGFSFLTYTELGIKDNFIIRSVYHN
ncbi:hypothetical protein [Tenacibaculum agarivorans]|uniref:hypothetical protein n=1 Tax=Tenacibaculum agarivorans TaxID=1908389 RepID=UPI00094BAADC|nr:hypothetical protein [Tenacibaculum agarivorans]